MICSQFAFFYFFLIHLLIDDMPSIRRLRRFFALIVQIFLLFALLVGLIAFSVGYIDVVRLLIIEISL